MLRPRALFPVLGLAACLGCGASSALEQEQRIERTTALVEDGGTSPFQARLAFKAPEAMAIQDIEALPGGGDVQALRAAYARYSSQWTFLLTIGPKPGAKVDPQRPFALDIENNGGMWGDFDRNLHRLMFEMGDFIRLRTPKGDEVRPSLVAFQRGFGMGYDRSFLLVFPKVKEGQRLEPPFEIRIRDFGQGMGLLKFQVVSTPPALSDWRLRRLWKATLINRQDAKG